MPPPLAAAPWWSDVVLIILENTIMGACMLASRLLQSRLQACIGTPFFPFMRCCRDFSSGEYVRLWAASLTRPAASAAGLIIILCTKARQARLISKWIMAPRKPEQEQEVLEWIEAVLEEPLPKGDYEEVILWPTSIWRDFCNANELQLPEKAAAADIANLVKLIRVTI